METIDQTSWSDKDEQLRNDQFGMEREEGMTGSDRMTDARLPASENKAADEDDETLADDDINGRDLDIENGDEWDEDNVSDKDLDEDDLMDTDQANFEVHQIKEDHFGSLATSITDNVNPDPKPDEIPEEHEDGNNVDYPDADRMEQGADKEVIYKEEKEVEQPRENEAPEPRPATLNNLDASFTGNNYGRATGRIIDHEPGTLNDI